MAPTPRRAASPARTPARTPARAGPKAKAESSTSAATLALRSGLALAALAVALAAKLAFPTGGFGLGRTVSPFCDPAVGCTPAQLAAKRAPRPLASYTHHSLQAAWGKAPADIELVDIVDAILPRSPPGAVVNLGARDGKTHDPTYPLFARGHPGAAFEGWEPVFPELDANLGPFEKSGVVVVHEYARPDTFASKLAGAGVTPGNLDVLKIDIDGFDLALARAVLEAGFRPKVVLMEINSDVPAPFIFETQFREGWELYFGAGFYGTSIAAVADLWEPHGYTLLAAQLDDPEHNVILVRDDALKAAPRVAADRARAAVLAHPTTAFPTDVCSLYYTAMAPQPPAAIATSSPLSPGYHCIHACEDDSPNYEALPVGKFDVTTAWQRFGLAGGSSVDEVYSLVHGVFSAAADDHAARIGGVNAFSMGVLRHLDPATCGAGLPTGRRYEKFLDE